MSFMEDLHKAKRSKEFNEKEYQQYLKITRLKREHKFKELDPVVKEMLDALGMATWGSVNGERTYKIHSDIQEFYWRLYSGQFEYVLKLIFDEGGDEASNDYFEVGVMGNMARTFDTSRKSLEYILKTIYKRGPDYLGGIDQGKSGKDKKKK